MRPYLYTITIIAGLSLLGSCNPNPQPGAKALLEQSERLVDTHPDSAMRLIDSLFFPEKSLRHEDYMRFLVIRVQAKYKTYRSIDEDTLVFRARDYFSGNNKDPRITALAWFYSGCVHRERKELAKSAQHYSRAGEFAAQTGDMALQGLVQYNTGDLLLEQGLYKEALGYYAKAEGFYRQSPDKPHEKQAQCLSAMGRMYMYLQQPDSAFHFFHNGLELAQAAGDTRLQSLLSQNLSVAYVNIGQFDKAESYLKQSFTLNTDSAEILRYYLNFAKLYAGMGRQDYVTLYTNQLKLRMVDRELDNLLKASIYRFLSVTEKENGNINAAFGYQELYTSMVEEITKDRLQQLVYEIQRKYDYEKMKAHHERRVNVFLFWTIVLLLVIVTGGSFFKWYVLRQRKKQAHTQQQMKILQGIAADLNKTLESKISDKEHDLRELLLWKFDVVKKSALLDRYSARKMNAAELVKIFHQIVYQGNKNGHWQNILSVIDQMNKGVPEKIKRIFLGLTETEYKITLLTYAGMSVKDISVILDLSPNTVQTYRTALRKKLGIEEISVDTVTFLKDRLDKT